MVAESETRTMAQWPAVDRRHRPWAMQCPVDAAVGDDGSRFQMEWTVGTANHRSGGVVSDGGAAVDNVSGHGCRVGETMTAVRETVPLAEPWAVRPFHSAVLRVGAAVAPEPPRAVVSSSLSFVAAVGGARAELPLLGTTTMTAPLVA